MSIQERIEKLEKELAEIKAELNKPREEFKIDDTYWFISHYGCIEMLRWNNNNNDNFKLSVNNAFHTKKEAEARKQRLIVHNKLKQIAKRLNNGIEIDWGRPDGKWHLFLYLGETIDHLYNQQSKIGGVIYCLSKNFKDVAIQEIGEELLIDYLKYGV